MQVYTTSIDKKAAINSGFRMHVGILDTPMNIEQAHTITRLLALEVHQTNPQLIHSQQLEI